MDADWVHSGMALKLAAIKTMLDRLPPETSVSITSAAKLTRELFTHTGAGTLIRRGEKIEWLPTLSGSRATQVEALLSQSFGRTLRSDWLADREVAGWLVAESNRAAALIVHGANGIPYLDKIVVTPEAQGEGLGAALWSALRARCPAMYWRSRVTNPINAWYHQQAEMSYRSGEWVIFAIGLDDWSAFGSLVKDAEAREPGWVNEP